MPETLAQRSPGEAAWPAGDPAAPEHALEVDGLTVRARGRVLLSAVDLAIPRRGLFALLGPSGAGKTTLLKCLNRMNELDPSLAVSGNVLFNGRSIYRPGLDGDRLRARIGFILQQPVIFPGSILVNACFGLRRVALADGRRAPRREWRERACTALADAALWDEVADRLDEPASLLSAGQKQRLCLARALALGPEVLLLDEPTSALDEHSTAAIEALIGALKERCALVLVTHDLAQARRVADRAAWLSAPPPGGNGGQIAHVGSPDNVIARAASARTLDFPA